MQDFLVGMGDTLFLSTPSARRATQGSRPDRQAHAISIHALREEGDEQEVISMLRKEMNFYPRPPRGGRHSTTGGSESDVLFLSTPSARRATFFMSFGNTLDEGDFYPRPPRGGRPVFL